MSICANAHAHMKRRDKEADDLKKKKKGLSNEPTVAEQNLLSPQSQKKKIFF